MLKWFKKQHWLLQIVLAFIVLNFVVALVGVVLGG